MPERIQIQVRMDPALLRRVDEFADKMREQLGVAGTKWSRNDQIVWMLTTAVEDSMVSGAIAAKRGGKKRG